MIDLMEMEFKEKFPLARSDSHKRQNGILTVISGSGMMVGAPIFNLLGASAVGTGYIYGVIETSLLPIVGAKCPWVVFKDNYDENHSQESQNAILIGSGCDLRNDFDSMFKRVLADKAPIVLDAYALRRYKDLGLFRNGCASIDDGRADKAVIMTPHVGEFCYMTGLKPSQLESDMVRYARDFAYRENVILVLKSHKTVVTDGEEAFVNDSGCQGLAKAGSGDVLSGMIAGLVARGVKPFLAAKMGVWLHGYASVRCHEHMAISAMQPTDIVEEVKNILFEWGK